MFSLLMPVISKSADSPRVSWLHAAKRFLHFCISLCIALRLLASENWIFYCIVYCIMITGFRKLNFSILAYGAKLRYYRWSQGVSVSHSLPCSSTSCHCLATNTATQSFLNFSLSVAWQRKLRCASGESCPVLQHTTHGHTWCAHRTLLTPLLSLRPKIN